MNALRTFATPSADGTLTIQVPEEYREQEVEVIILPIKDYGIPKDRFYLENVAKIQSQDQRNLDIKKSMAQMAREAAERGLTPDILDEILNNP